MASDDKPVARTDGGKFAPGTSGNPSGRPRDFTSFAKLARSRAPRALEILEGIMESTVESSADRIRAASIILDRAYGRPITPEASVTMDGDDKSEPMTETQRIDVARRVMAALRVGIDARFPGEQLGSKPMSFAEAAVLLEGEPTEAQLAEIKGRTWWNRQALPAKTGSLSLSEFRAATAAAMRARAVDAEVIKQEKDDATE